MTESFGIVAALLVGLLGSVHCIGMCGGISGVLAAGNATGSGARRIGNTLSYNLGRIFSYGVAGFIAGHAGRATYDLFPVARVAEVGLLLSGLFMIAMGLYLADWWRGISRVESAGSILWRRIQPYSRHFLPVKSPWQALSLGILWGWLPCGLVYATLVWALFAADPMRSMSIMIAFGIGTLPMLLAMGGLADQLARLRSRPVIRRTAGILIIVFGAATFMGWAHPMHPLDHPVGAICTV